MLQACRDADYGRVLACLEDGADINAKDADGETMLAMLAGIKLPAEQRMFCTLLDWGADWTLGSSDGWFPLEIACEMGNAPVVRELLDAGADPEGAASSGLTPLGWAAMKSRYEVMRALLDCGVDPNGRWHSVKPVQTPLHVSGDAFAARLLLSAGADPMLHADDGLLPIHSAIVAGRYEVVLEFLSAGVDVNVTTSAQNGEATGLHLAAAHGEFELLEFLFDRGADTSVIDRRGMTVLHHACASGNDKIALHLIDGGLDWALEVGDVENVRPLEYLRAKKIAQIMNSRVAASAIECAFYSEEHPSDGPIASVKPVKFSL